VQTFNSFNELNAAQSATPLQSQMIVFNAKQATKAYQSVDEIWENGDSPENLINVADEAEEAGYSRLASLYRTYAKIRMKEKPTEHDLAYIYSDDFERMVTSDEGFEEFPAIFDPK